MHARPMLLFCQIKIRQIFKNTIWRLFRQINFLSNFPAIRYKKFYLFCSYHDHLKNAIIHEIQGKARMKSSQRDYEDELEVTIQVLINTLFTEGA